MYLPMNLNDLSLWENGTLRGFALPLGFLPKVGDTVGILEPFKKLFVLESIEKSGKMIEKKTLAGVMYRSDNAYAWSIDTVPDEYVVAGKWSPAEHMPEFAIRRRAIITKFEWKPLQSFSAEDIQLLHLDYESQNNPQMLMKEYASIKNFELLYAWWKQHYQSTLKDGDNPKAIILHLDPTNN